MTHQSAFPSLRPRTCGTAFDDQSGHVFYSEFTIAKNQNTYAKRQREQEKKQRADEKRTKRDKKKDGTYVPAPIREHLYPSEDRSP